MLHAPIDLERSEAAPHPQGGWAHPLGRFAPEAAGIAVALAVAAIFLAIDPVPDVAWQLWTGHQLRHGARLYVDIVETNPPLWFWMAMPVDWIGQLSGAGPSKAMIAAMAGLSALSVAATGRLIDGSIRSRTLLLSYVAATLMLMPLSDLGQREQILLIGAVPYAVLAAGRREGRPVPTSLAMAIGIGGAAGFALKHYFLIAPALLEVWLLVELRRGYRPARPETLALAASGILYAVAVLTLTPAYLHDILPMLRLTYGALEVRHLSDMLGVTQTYWAIMLGLLLYRRDLLRQAPIATALAIVAVGLAGAWWIQLKGWHNHQIPVTGCLMLAVAAFVAVHWRKLDSAVWVAVPTLLVMPLVSALVITPYADPAHAYTRPMLAGLAATDSVAFVSKNSTYAWPLSLKRRSRYPSRHYGMWMLTALVRGDAPDPALIRLGRRVVEETAIDYGCTQPQRIVFDELERDTFDLEGFFLSSPSFAQLMTHYRRTGRYRQFDMFERIAPFQGPPASACPRIG